MKNPFYYIVTLLLCFANISAFASEKDVQKGVCIVSWQKEGYNDYSNQMLKKISKTGANSVSIIVTQYQTACDSTKIFPTDKTPSDSAVTSLIRRAHSNGFKVMLKPHIDILGAKNTAEYRGDIGFFTESEWHEWFTEYQQFILHYAQIAENSKVELFCIGTELSFAAQKTDLWVNMIIKEVKNIYSGKLLYAANWDNYKNVGFWEELDFVGIDAYFPTTYRNNPSFTQIYRGWEKWKAEIGKWHKIVKKPIIFSEIGYPPTDYAAASPWNYNVNGKHNVELQAKCYKGFFESIWGCSWLAGAYCWYVSPGNLDEKNSYNIHKKPAENILKKYYKK